MMRRIRRPGSGRLGAGTAAALLAATVGASMGTLSGSTAIAAPAADGAAGTSQAVIVILKDQLSDAPPDQGHLADRRSRADSAQRSVLGHLGGAQPTKVRNYTSVNGFAATVTTAQAETLAADPAVAAVVPDRTVEVQPPATPATGATGQGAVASGVTPKAVSPKVAPSPAPGACPTDPAHPLLEPEALQVTRTAFDNPATPSAQQLATGKGVTVAFIADGLDPNLPDLIRADGSHVIVDYQDFSGEGPNAPANGAEAFGDVSSIAAQGRFPYDLANFVNPAYALPAGCTIRVLGMAPGANVIALKAGGELLPNSAILQSIDYAIGKHVDVINESFGANIVADNSSRDTIQMFNNAAVRQGITVTVSSGDAGISGTIGSPATDPNVISVGASTISRVYAQTGYAAFRFSNGTWADNNISALSSGGFTQGGRTMDLVAPGEGGWALCSTSPQFSGCPSFAGTASPVQPFGGTSEAAPLTAGAAALVIQAYRTAHGGHSPSPALVKQILTSTSHDLGLPAEEQGAGLLDARAAVEAATTIDRPNGYGNGSLASNVLVTPNQLDLTARPGQDRRTTVTVTNVGTRDQTVSLGTRGYATIADTRATANLHPGTDPTFPYATNGVPWAYQKVTFKVPAGADRLGVSIAWQGAARKTSTGATVTPVVRMTLIDPTGRFQTNTRPQGGAVSANFGFVDVPHPPAGLWTAVLYTVASQSGYTGAVLVDATSSRAVPAGNASPPVLRLRPGQSGTATVSLTAPDGSGDTSESITVGSSGGHQASIPVIMRTLVDTSGGTGTFTGTITGGNARSFAPAQTSTYAFDVPPGKRDLDLGLTLAKDPNVLLEGILVDPDGESIDVGTNGRFDPTFTRTGTGATMAQVVANPQPGRWRFVLLVQNPVSGAEISQDFTGTIAFNQVKAGAAGLPTSTRTRLKAGSAQTATITYTNTGKAPVMLQADARRDGRQDVQLAPVGSSATVDLPLQPTSTVPEWLVPPGTDRLTLAATSTTPAQVELQEPTGGIDVFGDLKSAQRGETVSVARVSESDGRMVAPGIWLDFVQQIGPFSGPAPAGTSTMVATAHTQPLDADVASSTGDFWHQSTDVNGAQGTPLVVQPGQTVQVTVTITPHGAKGTQVHGVLYLTAPPQFDLPNFSTSGDVLAALPYSYTVN